MMQTILFVSQTIAFAAKTIVLKVGQSFASPQLVVFGARSPLASFLLREIHQKIERIIKYNKNGKCALQNLSSIIL
jgi:hypothetical protein